MKFKFIELLLLLMVGLAAPGVAQEPASFQLDGNTLKVPSAVVFEAGSERRAMAVARALVAMGVDCKRLLPVGFGSTKPGGESGLCLSMPPWEGARLGACPSTEAVRWPGVPAARAG